MSKAELDPLSTQEAPPDTPRHAANRAANHVAGRAAFVCGWLDHLEWEMPSGLARAHGELHEALMAYEKAITRLEDG